MSFKLEVDDQESITTVTVSGPVDLRAMVRALGDMVRRPTFNVKHDLVVDLRKMSEFPASVGELRVLAWTLGQEGAIANRKVALLLPEGSNEPLLGRVEHLNKMGGFRLAAFPGITEAVNWLRAA